MTKIEDTKIMYEVRERIASMETAITYLNENIHALRKEIHTKKSNPLWLRVAIIINTGTAAWLSVLTYIVVQKL